MNRVTVEYGDVNRLVADLRGAPAICQRQVLEAIRRTALAIEADAKAFAPVDTGFLRNSIGIDVDQDGLGAAIGPAAEYAPFVEWGTSTNAPQAFMGPAFDRHAGDLSKSILQIAGDVL